MILKPDVAEPTAAKPVTTPVDAPGLLKQVVEQVQRDSVKQSDEYLEETNVPHGGE